MPASGRPPVGEHWDISLRELAFAAIEAAQKDARGSASRKPYLWAICWPRTLSAQAHLGALVADFAGLTGIEAVTVEAAGASGGGALRMGYLTLKPAQRTSPWWSA